MSETLLIAAIIGYVVAMALHTAEVVVPQRARALGVAALVATVLTVIVHAACVLTRAAEARRVPWGNMYEFLLTAALAGALTWLVLLTRPRLRPLGLFVTLTLALALGAAGRVYVRANALPPPLQSPWLRVHVATAALATGLFLVGFVATALYLARLRGANHLPELSTLDRLAARMHQIAFPIWTFAVATGAVWAEAAWGRYWGWDPKETWAFISWTLYASYLHARSTAGWRGRPAAVIACAAWASMLINVFVVNIFVSGLHSYAGF
ncbi:c-type cytochrome biogenesis protein CcsB [Allorhizocola rhizosphaerae]|uniref:c-type cytochrome biogenesis protein CcsB n=1 Tax=Allorhizocola rhizosphaerae TaxID=1872709 RepID=UPI000E3C21DA|nr:c-type cytochrome biogenesis protein CcsB [Allorhizocola rhizosphaerae]